MKLQTCQLKYHDYSWRVIQQLYVAHSFTPGPNRTNQLKYSVITIYFDDGLNSVAFFRDVST